MKEKRILAMFITSAITLVASLAVTLGVLTTLADPTIASGINRYTYAFGNKNVADSKINYDGNTIKLKEDVVFQPANKVVWTENTDNSTTPVWFDENIDKNITYANESMSSKMKVVPIRISNTFNETITVSVNVAYTQKTLLGSYMVIKIYDFKTGTFEDFTGSKTFELVANTTREIAVVIFADDSANLADKTVNWGTDYETLNVEIKDTTHVA